MDESNCLPGSRAGPRWEVPRLKEDLESRTFEKVRGGNFSTLPLLRLCLHWSSAHLPCSTAFSLWNGNLGAFIGHQDGAECQTRSQPHIGGWGYTNVMWFSKTQP